MASKRSTSTTPEAAGSTGSSGDGAVLRASPSAGPGRRPGALTQEEKDAILYWDEDRRAALLALLWASPGQLTISQIGQLLAKHPAFQDQAALIGDGSSKTAEKIRVRINKEIAGIEAKAEEAAKAGQSFPYPVPQYKYAGSGGRGSSGSLMSVLAKAAAAVGGAGVVAPTAPTVPSGLVSAPAFVGSGLIPIPQA